MIGCNEHSDEYTDISTSIYVKVITIDSCEYINGYNRLAHKGNCKYCEKRLKRLIENLKEK